jgi:hypothetical protein
MPYAPKWEQQERERESERLSRCRRRMKCISFLSSGLKCKPIKRPTRSRRQTDPEYGSYFSSEMSVDFHRIHGYISTKKKLIDLEIDSDVIKNVNESDKVR